MLLKKHLIYKRPIKKPGCRYRGKKLIFSRNTVPGEFSCRRCLLCHKKDDLYTCRQYKILPDLDLTEMTIETFCCNRTNDENSLIRNYHVSHLE